MGKRDRDETKEEKAARKLAKKQKKEQSKSKSKSKQQKKSKSSTSATLSGEKSISASKQLTTSGGRPRVQSSSKKNHRHFLKKRIQLAISLLPGSLKNTEESIENALRLMLLKYSNGMGGILMAFDDVVIIQDKYSQGRGFILNELPYIHYTVECNALVFAPVIGAELSGTVNECFPSHIGCLVHSYFNAMVSADELRAAGFHFDTDEHVWNHQNVTISNESPVSFVVEKIHEVEGTVSLEGVQPKLNLLVDEAA